MGLEINKWLCRLPSQKICAVLVVWLWLDGGRREVEEKLCCSDI